MQRVSYDAIVSLSIIPSEGVWIGGLIELILGRFQGVFKVFFGGGVMRCCTVSCVVFVLLFLTDGYANYQPFLFLCVNFLWVMQAFFCDK